MRASQAEQSSAVVIGSNPRRQSGTRCSPGDSVLTVGPPVQAVDAVAGRVLAE